MEIQTGSGCIYWKSLSYRTGLPSTTSSDSRLTNPFHAFASTGQKVLTDR